jgi:hypothetical protein
MPGGSPQGPDEAHIEALYANLEALFQATAGRFTGMTLAAFRQHWQERSRPVQVAAASARRPLIETCPPAV